MTNVKGLCSKWQKPDNYIVFRDLLSFYSARVSEEPILKPK